MKINRLLVAITTTTLLLTACAEDVAQTQKQQEMDSQSIKDLVYDYSVGNIEVENASITSEYLIVQDVNQEEQKYELPEDEFFVSIAPYINNTHPCTNHNLTSCQGELASETFDVVIADSTGNVIVSKSIESGENGFVDMWLPRDKEYQVTIEHDGKIAESNLSTFKTDGTCVTTMQLL
ncbi:CueP family metal-binding protein [Chengkuizengella axinellae]|uniref:CueP family metal-binding protein n=1 Tax=Chengkuizengella axinellae TaxID=3064388 RepID=A0ABT9J063_9BACL|nr:CueP family metal-binding protein [Chengkuizengella sp. 2205SS18-9]MDP5274955.1 CueP family metal-binding protein [Chengkuizengella sp. 2205SS18-9]